MVVGDGVGGEHDAGLLGADHALHHHGDGDAALVEVLLLAVEDSPVIVQGGPALLDVLHHVIVADDKEEGLLLTGKAGVVQVLGGAAGADGHRLVTIADLRVEGDDIHRHLAGNRRIDDVLTDLSSHGDQGGVAGEIDGGQLLKDVVPQAVGLHEGVEHFRADDEALGNGEVRPGHTAQAGTLAAGRAAQRLVGNFIKPCQILIHCCCSFLNPVGSWAGVMISCWEKLCGTPGLRVPHR